MFIYLDLFTVHSIARNIVSKQRSCLMSTLNTYELFNKNIKIRPTLDDIERISYGQAAKRRGTGNTFCF